MNKDYIPLINNGNIAEAIKLKTIEGGLKMLRVGWSNTL